MTGLDYQAAGFWLAAFATVLSIVSTVCAIVMWWGRKGQITQEAIDRVERTARDLVSAAEHNEQTRHADQEARIVRLESDMKNMLTADHLNKALDPLYGLVRDSKSSEAALAADMRTVREQLGVLIRTFIDRGMNSQ